MIILFYSEIGHPHSDFGVQEYVNELCEQHQEPNVERHYTSTENMVYAFRVAIKLGLLDHKEFTLLDHNNNEYMFDKDARPLNGYYEGSYLDYALDTLIGI